MTDSDKIKQLKAALLIALERYRESDYHWSLEFHHVPAQIDDYTPGMPNDADNMHDGENDVRFNEFNSLMALAKE